MNTSAPGGSLLIVMRRSTVPQPASSTSSIATRNIATAPARNMGGEYTKHHALSRVPTLERMLFLVVITFLLAADLVWWHWADGRAKNLRRPRAWRIVLAAFMSLQLGYLLYFIVAPAAARHAHEWMPMPMLVTIYLWHLLVLPGAF